ncbi:MAG: efflux RND transporter periplasmic adaptor subunit [Candidatus Binatia bacterium]
MKRQRTYHSICESGLSVGPWLVLFILNVLLGLTACGREAAKPKPQPPAEVSVVKVEPRDTPITFEHVAQTQSSHQVEIRARVNGFLEKRVYTEGSIVKAGQTLFLMDKKPFQAQVDAAAAALSKQKAALETARRNLERVKPLAERNALSKKDLDDAIGSHESLAAAVEQAEAELRTARLNLSYCTIDSPVAGITGAALQQDGAYVNAESSHLTTVEALSPIWVNFSVSENEMQEYRDQVANKIIIPPAQDNYRVEVIMVDGSLFPEKGRITFTAPSFNAKTGTFLIRANVANPGGILRPNQFVRVRLNGAIRPNAILVPQRAVQQGAKGHFVWVVNEEKKAESRPVTVGDWHGDDWFINEGLRAGEQVVVDGSLTLHPGAVVAAKPLVLPELQSHDGTQKSGEPKAASKNR